MYTKITAACGSRCNGKAHYLKTFGPSLSFPFPRWTSKSSLELHPLVCSGLLTPDISIKSGDIAPKRRVGTDADGMSANLCLNSDHSWQHHSFFKSLAINVAWNCNVISPNGTSVWKSATVKVDTDILSGNDWQASWHIVASAFQHKRSAEGIFPSSRHRLHPQWNTPFCFDVRWWWYYLCRVVFSKKEFGLCNIRQTEMTLRRSKAGWVKSQGFESVVECIKI